MARSKRAPVYIEGYGSPDKPRRKRQAARRVRKSDVANGSAYKKVSNSWDICDYKITASKNDKKAGRK